ncbi:MAG: NAD(P)/FAD-dependent oxidoreductase, partial [Salinivirgaceae bacterium]|nr:NAD(P)/FAD-dependent oxidoreductase [Salinivirgaceae bacterium]
SEKKYNFNVQVNWVNEPNNEVVFEYLQSIVLENPKKILSTIKPYFLPERLWLFLLQKRGFSADKKWGEMGSKSIHKLVSVLTDDVYEVSGKTTFRDEFVTCGGVSLQSINLNTMESRACKNLYFAGEVLDIDAITGGFNLQAAWTTGFIAGKLL